MNRKLRGLLGIGLTWGILWTAVTAAIGLIIGLTNPGSVDPGDEWIALAMGFVGVVSGVAFGIVLSFAESRKRILDLSLGRVATWGILGSAALPLLTGMQDKLVLITCPLGAAFAAGTVAIARRAELDDSERPELLKAHS